MNVVFLHSHNTGTFVQPYGHAVPTPNLQRLAEQGVTFRKAFAAARSLVSSLDSAAAAESRVIRQRQINPKTMAQRAAGFRK